MTAGRRYDPRKGRPTIAQSDKERCEALTVMTWWKSKNKKEQRCPFSARYLVQGKLLCRHHAVNEAVAICTERGDLKQISPPSPPGARVPTIHGNHAKGPTE